MSRSFTATNDDRLTTGSFPTTATDNWTMSIWAKMADAPSQTVTLMSNGFDGGGTGDGYNITVGTDFVPDGNLSFVANVPSGVTVSANTWFNVVFTRKSGTSKCYVDGDGSSSSTSGSAPNALAEKGFRLGIEITNSDTYQREFDDLLAEAAIWDRALSDDEIAAIGAGYSPLFFATNLQGYWPVKGKYSPETDIVGGLDLTVTGATAGDDHPPIIYPSGFQNAITAAAVVGGANTRRYTLSTLGVG